MYPKLYKYWWTINAVLFLLTIGMFHAGIFMATIFSQLQSDLSILDRLFIFMFALPFNLFMVITIREEVIKARN